MGILTNHRIIPPRPKCVIYRPPKAEEIKEEIIVSFTSWEKRIQYCKHIFEIMWGQTLKPYKIILNLSIEEFPNKENNLPQDLVEYVNSHNGCEIYWVEENTKVWKKIIPTLNRFPNDVIISIDDDIDYPNNYIEEMYKTYTENGKSHPVVAFKYYTNKKLSHSGPFTLTKMSFFGRFLNEVYNGLIKNEIKTTFWQSDMVYFYIAMLAGTEYVPCNTIDGNAIYKHSLHNKENAYSVYSSKKWKNSYNRNIKVLSDYFHLHYGSTIDKLMEGNPIIVNFTTWKKRDMYVPTMLRQFANQTLKPDKIICWLSQTEYNGIIPDTIKECLEEGLLTEVRFVKGNTYSHKRWETFKDNGNAYNIMIDDDILYSPLHVEELYNAAKQYRDSVIIWDSRTNIYSGTTRIDKRCIRLKPDRMIQTLSGMSCYPPHTFPYQSFNYVNLRDKYCTKCDDSWVRAWLIKEGRTIVPVHDVRVTLWNIIDGTLEDSLYYENRVVTNGVAKMTRNFANALKIANATKEALELWPDFDIEACVDDDLKD